MRDQPSLPTFAPRPQATSVADYYQRSFERAFAGVLTENLGRLPEHPTWEEEALGSMLVELASARSQQLDHVARIITTCGGELNAEMRQHLERLGRVAVELASVSTLLHWGWIKGEHLVRVGAAMLERLDSAGEQ